MFIDSLAGGGAERVATTLSNWLAERHEVTVLTFWEAPDAYRLGPRVGRLHWHLLPAPQLLGKRLPFFSFLHNAWQLLPIVRSLRPDLVLCFMESANILGGLVSLLAGIPFCFSERCHPEALTSARRWPVRFWRALTYRLAQGCIVQSGAAADWARSYLPERRIRILPNPLVRKVASGTPQAERQPLLLCVSRLVQGKGLLELLDVFARLAPAFPSWRLRLAGEGPMRPSLEARARQQDLNGRVELPGWREDVTEEYERASAFVLFSESEGMPNALLEALSHQLPCLTSRSFPACQELLESDRDALLVEVADLAGLESGLVRLLSSHELRKRLAAAGSERVSDYQLEKVGPLWEETLLAWAEWRGRPSR
ncbi:glycosyltransferase [bacterium]|nr:glycosyltransferase [bacterium]